MLPKTDKTDKSDFIPDPTPGYVIGDQGGRYAPSRMISTLDKALWASEENIAAANDALKKAGSFIMLEKVGIGSSYDSAYRPGTTIFKVKPVWNKDKKLGPRDAERKRLAEANAKSETFIAHADCFMNAQTVMGVSDAPTGVNNTTVPYVRIKSEHKKIKALTNLDMNDKYGGTGLTAVFGGGSPSRGHYAFLLEAFPVFLDALQKPSEIGVDASAAKTFHEAQSKYVKVYDKAGLTALIRAYGELCTVPTYHTLYHAFGKMFGVNEYLAPQVGEGLAIFNDPFERKESQEKIEKGTLSSDLELWNYHFAGVIMTEGDTYVTFENYSIGDENADNSDWLFQVYGPGSQSFHRELSTKKGIGKKALTLSFDRTK